MPERFYDKVEEGSIILEKLNARFCDKGILINGVFAAPLKTDLVILAIGFRVDVKIKNNFK